MLNVKTQISNTFFEISTLSFPSLYAYTYPVVMEQNTMKNVNKWCDAKSFA